MSRLQQLIPSFKRGKHKKRTSKTGSTHSYIPKPSSYQDNSSLSNAPLIGPSHLNDRSEDLGSTNFGDNFQWEIVSDNPEVYVEFDEGTETPFEHRDLTPSSYASWTVVTLRDKYNHLENMLGFGTFLLDIRDLSDLRPNYYYLDTEIYKTLPNWSLLVPPAATSAEAAISGEVWAATLANFTHSDAESTNIRPIIREEGESQDEWNHRNLHPKDHWTSENPCVVERLQKSFKQVLDGDGRWPGRVAEVECHQQYCEVPLGKTTIKFIFDPCLSLEEVGKFYTAQHNKEPPSTEGLYPDDDGSFVD